MANLKTVLEDRLEQGCPSLRAKAQRRGKLVKSVTVATATICSKCGEDWLDQLKGQCVRRWEERETVYFFGKQGNKTKLTVGQAQACEAWRKVRRVLGKKVEVEGAGTVRSDKSRLFEIENKSGHNNYFWKKNESS